MNLALQLPAVRLCVVAAGVFFLTGLLTGAWKYSHIARSASATSPVYVDLAHRAALMYSFASLLLAVFAALSAYPPMTNLVAAALPLAFFGLAIGGYVVHGILRDTDNQFARPQRVGRVALPPAALAAFMWALMAAEIGGFAVLFAGFLKGL
jgi:hypothetical protein